MKQTIHQRNLQKFLKSLKNKKKKIFYLFDYDGVLVPIQKNPYTAFLSKSRRSELYRLAKSSKVALVSGRTLSTLKKLSRIRNKNIILVGSHGLEMFYKNKTTLLDKHNVSMLKKIKPQILKIAKATAKGFLEKKPYTVTYHIRDKKSMSLVKKLSKRLDTLLKKSKLSKIFKVLEGKNIIEVMPKNINKGKAVEKIIKMFPKCLYVYFGDDVTDIAAFEMLKKYKGITVSLNSKLKYNTDFSLDYKMFPLELM